MKSRALLAGVAALASCASSSTSSLSSSGSGSLGLAAEDSFTLRLDHAPAAHYGRGGPTETTPAKAAVRRQVRRAARQAGVAVPRTDAADDGATDTVCRGLLPAGPPPAPLVDFALRAHGLIDPPPHLLVVSVGDDEAISPRLEQGIAQVLAQRRYLRFGVGVCRPELARGDRRVVVALFAGRVTLSRPLARRVQVGSKHTLSVKLSGRYRSPKLVVAHPDGKVTTRTLRGSSKSYRGSFRCRPRGAVRVEVTAEGRHGSEVLANFPVYCGTKMPRAVRYSRRRPRIGDVAQLEAQMVALTNRFRERAGLSSLARDQPLARIARAHSSDMRAHGFVGHVSPTTGGPADRARRAGVAYLVLRENVARAYSPREALSELAASPAHLGNLLSKDVTHLGVGIAVDRAGDAPVLFVTQMFRKPAEAIDRRNVGAQLRRIIDHRRRDKGLAELSRSAALERLAKRYLALYRERGQARADAALSRGIAKLGRSFRQVGGMLVKLSALETVAEAGDLLSRDVTHIGVAAFADDDTITVFILLGRAR